MGKNRTIPFGYMMQNGIITTNPAEVLAVLTIFSEYMVGKSLENIWDEIMHNYLTLKEWFSDHEFYHKIGYLIASNSKSLMDVLNDYSDKTKTEFRQYLDESIKTSISFKKSFNELDYEHD